MKIRLQSGTSSGTQPLWLRLLTIFCIGLISVGSTAQVCHAHVDSFESSLLQIQASGGTHALPTLDGQVTDQSSSNSDASSAINCPLCVAMHSALPVADSLPRVALLKLATVAPHADSIDRIFSWRFEMASRPPPAKRTRA